MDVKTAGARRFDTAGRMVKMGNIIDGAGIRKMAVGSVCAPPGGRQSMQTRHPLLAAGDILALDEVQATAGGAVAVVAPGTGLGEACLVWDGTRHRAYPPACCPWCMPCC
jgi:hypothetical protein